MTTANTSLRVTELDYDEIRENLKTYLRNQSEFTDYDFEGSGLSVLLDLLAYNTHYMGFFSHMLANESFGDTAQLRASIMSHAKHLNYTPTSKRGARALINVNVTPNPSTEDTDANTATLSKYTKVLGRAKDGKNHQFVTLNSNTATKANGSFAFSNVWLGQGEVVTKQFVMTTDNTKRRFVIPSANVDTTTMTIQVQESSSNTAKSTYVPLSDITTAASNSEIYTITEESVSNGVFTIQFGDGYIGKAPANGSIVICTYLEANGDESNDLENFVFTDPVDGFSSNTTITSVTKSSGGAERESIEEIRYRAPKFYTIQDRGVTPEDMRQILLRKYPQIQAASVWSGKDNDPPVYGKVFFSLSPMNGHELTITEKERIVTEVINETGIMTATPEIIDPDYNHLLLKVTVNYNPNLTALESNEVSAIVRQAIIDYRDSDLQKFNSTFRKSKLQRVIDSSERSILSNDVQIFLQKRHEIDPGSTTSFTLEAAQEFRKNLFPLDAYTFPSVTVRDSSDIERQVFYEIIPDSFSGISGINVNDPGTSYTETPTVTISGDGQGATATAKVVNGRVQSISVDSEGSSYTRATVTITGNGSGAAATAQIGGEIATLRTYYFKDNGEKGIVDENAGTVYFDTGIVEFNDVLPLSVTQNSAYANNNFTFNIQPEKETLMPVRNKLFDIDANDPNAITITMVADEDV